MTDEARAAATGAGAPPAGEARAARLRPAVSVSPRLELLVVAGLGLLALAVRWIRWERTVALFNDGPRFLAMARMMAADRWAAAFGEDYHPLYPFLVMLAGLGRPDLENVAAAVSVAAGAVAVLLLYGLVRDAYGWPAAPLAALLLALHPYAVDFSSDVQSEGVYLAAFLGALWMGWRAVDRRAPALAGWTGAVGGLAYLTRPEGLGAIVVAGAAGAWEALRGRFRLLPAAGWALALLGGTLLVTGPYLGVLRVEGGSWTLTRKKSVAVVAGVEELAPHATRLAPGPGAPVVTPPPPEAPAPAAGPAASPGQAAPPAAEAPADGAGRHRRGPFHDLVSTVASAFRYEVLVLMLLGVASVRGRPGLRGRFFGGLLLLYAAVWVGMVTNVGYISRRHVLPVAAALLGYAALGLPVFARGAARLLARAGLRKRAAQLAGGLAAALVVLVGPVVELHGVRRGDEVALRDAARWLAAERPGPAGAVATSRARWAYYAGAPFVLVTGSGTPDAAALRRAGARYLVLDEGDLDAAQWSALLAEPGVRELHRVQEAGSAARVLALGGGEEEPRAQAPR